MGLGEKIRKFRHVGGRASAAGWLGPPKSGKQGRDEPKGSWMAGDKVERIQGSP